MAPTAAHASPRTCRHAASVWYLWRFRHAASVWYLWRFRHSQAWLDVTIPQWLVAITACTTKPNRQHAHLPRSRWKHEELHVTSPEPSVCSNLSQSGTVSSDQEMGLGSNRCRYCCRPSKDIQSNAQPPASHTGLRTTPALLFGWDYYSLDQHQRLVLAVSIQSDWESSSIWGQYHPKTVPVPVCTAPPGGRSICRSGFVCWETAETGWAHLRALRARAPTAKESMVHRWFAAD